MFVRSGGCAERNGAGFTPIFLGSGANFTSLGRSGVSYEFQISRNGRNIPIHFTPALFLLKAKLQKTKKKVLQN